MIKMIVLLRRNPALTRAEFSHHWREIHAPLVCSVPETTRHMRKYVQNHLPETSASSGDGAAESMGGVARPSDDMDFDGIIEVWYESMEELQKSTGSQRYAEIIRPDEQRLLDQSRCVIFLANEFTVFDEKNRPNAEAGR